MDTLVGTINLTIHSGYNAFKLYKERGTLQAWHDGPRSRSLIKTWHLHREVVLHFCDIVYWLETHLCCILMLCLTLYCRSKYQHVDRDLIYRPWSWLEISKRSGITTSVTFCACLELWPCHSLYFACDQFNHSLWFTRPEVKPIISNDNNHRDRGGWHI